MHQVEAAKSLPHQHPHQHSHQHSHQQHPPHAPRSAMYPSSSSYPPPPPQHSQPLADSSQPLAEAQAQAQAAQGYVGSYSPEARKERISRFIEKRKNRVWTKKVKYDVRKNFADSRIRVKVRCVGGGAISSIRVCVTTCLLCWDSL